ncbi:hypothetical protein [Methylocystis parvus]|uniref:hypothetical protein n=1 Tax=Methylocystis parvus TaxID=134 RepID=UPI003C7168DD
MFTYGQVEAALAKLHGVDSRALGAFRGRIKHFQRLGIVPSSPGRGRKISYEMEHVLIWTFCLELSQFGIDPTIIERFVRASGYAIIAEFEKASRLTEDIYWAFYPNIMSNWFYSDDGLFGTIRTDCFSASQVSATKIEVEFGRRVSLINLTKLKKELDAALEELKDD